MSELIANTLEAQLNKIVDDYILLIGQVKDKIEREGLINVFLSNLFDTANIIAKSKTPKDQWVKMFKDSIMEYLDENDSSYTNFKPEDILGKG